MKSSRVVARADYTLMTDGGNNLLPSTYVPSASNFVPEKLFYTVVVHSSSGSEDITLTNTIRVSSFVFVGLRSVVL